MSVNWKEMIAQFWFSANCSLLPPDQHLNDLARRSQIRLGGTGEARREHLVDHRPPLVLRQQGGVPGQHPQGQQLAKGVVGIGRLPVRFDEVLQDLGHLLPPEKSTQNAGLVALVHVADLLCRMSSLNYGYVEERQVNLFEDSGFALLAQDSTLLREFDWARLTFEVDSYIDEVRGLVRTIYRK